MSDIEEFLRRAAALRAQQAQRQAPRPAQGPTQGPTQGSTQGPTPHTQPPRTMPPFTAPLRPAMLPSSEVMEAEVVEAEEVTGEDVARLVEQHLDNRRFTQRASQMAESVRGTDDAMEVHLHETFEHRLGQLGATTSRAEDSTLDDQETAAKASPPRPSTPATLAQLLRSPSDLRNAMVLREILSRPDHLW